MDSYIEGFPQARHESEPMGRSVQAFCPKQSSEEIPEPEPFRRNAKLNTELGPPESSFDREPMDPAPVSETFLVLPDPIYPTGSLNSYAS